MSTDAKQRLLHALIVDDEAVIRRLIMTWLVKEGFTCDTAADGEQAAKLIAQKSYDLVVTDLAMPSRNGHSLAVELLAKADRPLIVVLTGLIEPKIVKDLMARGIDDIAFKPVEYSTFAAKLRCLTDRRRNAGTASSAPAIPVSASARPDQLPRVAPDEFEARVRGLTGLPPVSQSAIEVFKLTTNPDSDLRHVAAAVQRDPALITDILRLANSSFFNPSGKKISNVDQAVVRLGQKRVGELALTTAAFASIAQEKIPFFPLAHVWRECLASGICLEMLVDQAANEDSSSGSLFCTAVLQPMGRIMLASVFPEIYERMLRHAEQDHRPLADLETYVFPESTGDVVAKALASWGIPDEVHRPLRHASLSFPALAALSDPLRRRVELVKTAGFLGKLGTGRLESWDAVDVPPASVLKRLGIHAVDALLSQCRDDLEVVAAFAVGDDPSDMSDRPRPQTTVISGQLAYKRVQNDAVDLLPYVLAAGGIRLVNTSPDVSDIEGTVLVNTLGAAVHQVVARVRTPATTEILILADAENADRLQGYGRVIALPASYGLLHKICSAAASPANSSAETLVGAAGPA